MPSPAPAAPACCCSWSSATEATAGAVAAECLRRGVFVRQTQGSGIRVFPALTITRDELDEGLTLLEESIATVAG